jgi:hypothetical protein
MIITANGRSALMLAAGLLLGIAGPMHVTPGHAQDAAATTEATTEAAETAAPSKPIELKKFSKPRHARVAAKAHRSAKVAAKAASDAEAEPAKDASDGAAPATPDAFANANAQLPADAPAETPQTVSNQADNVLKVMGGNPDADAAPQAAPARDTTAGVVAPDQLNELDRAATDDKPALTLASATLDAPVVVSNEDSSTLDKTSLIGKIFIACGGLLTLASAARMFIA